ncbi:hypothetical protein FPV16_00340 [Methylobacterium sp. W2]|nr:hypothetical protein [Methylobacterium sp. W2]
MPSSGNSWTRPGCSTGRPRRFRSERIRQLSTRGKRDDPPPPPHHLILRTLRSSLEGGPRNPLRELEGSFEASAALRHFRLK